MKKFTRKWYGRIYIKDGINKERVEELIKILDEFEYDYLPSNLITTFDNYPQVEYTGKFEIDLDLLEANCINEGINIFCFDAWHQEYPNNDIIN